MKKNILLLLLSSLLLTGCVEKKVINVNMEGAASANVKGFIDICDSPIPLCYDSLTNVAYIKNSTYGFSYVYTVYYAPNGKPYLYDVKSSTFKMIEE